MKKFIQLCFFIILVNSLCAQEALKSSEEDYYDFLSLQGKIENPTLGYRTLSDSFWEISQETNHIWENNNLSLNKIIWESEYTSENWFTNGIYQGLKIKIYGPEWFNSYNTAVPYGQNDGGLWQGKGYNTSLTGGFRLEGYGFELTLKPQLSWMQNLPFETNSEIYKNPYSYTFTSEDGKFTHYIDYVQRYGDKSLYDFNLGDTEIRWTWNALTFGVGTQSPWLGPAQLNPMLGSNNATPYLKFDAGLRKMPVIIPGIGLNIGNIEGRIWTGKLTASDYFPYKEATNDRMLNAMSASYEPSFIPGFTFGLNRIFVTRWRKENLSYILRLFTLSRSNALSSSGNDEDQKFSIFIDWKFDKAGFEAYGEFGRDDFSSNENTNPFHTAIYTIGAKQFIPISSEIQSELYFEWNDLEMSQDFQIQWPYLGYYAHGDISQGYTNNGQILGAGSGSFGNSQLIGYKIYIPKGFVNLFYHRYCPNNNSIYSVGVYNKVDTNTNVTKTDFFNKWYANFETWNCIGLGAQYFVTSSLNVFLEYRFNNIECRNYNTKKSTYNNYLNFRLKYSF